jgi:hypothetical protein
MLKCDNLAYKNKVLEVRVNGSLLRLEQGSIMAVRFLG